MEQKDNIKTRELMRKKQIERKKKSHGSDI